MAVVVQLLYYFRLSICVDYILQTQLIDEFQIDLVPRKSGAPPSSPWKLDPSYATVQHC